MFSFRTLYLLCDFLPISKKLHLTRSKSLWICRRWCRTLRSWGLWETRGFLAWRCTYLNCFVNFRDLRQMGRKPGVGYSYFEVLTPKLRELRMNCSWMGRKLGLFLAGGCLPSD